MKILLFILLLFCIKQVSSQSCFNPTKLFTTNSNPYSFCSADINGDGKIDLAIANYGANNITLRLGRGDGTFQNATNYAVGTNPYEIISGDFNNDGKKDIAVTNFGSGTISVLLNNGAGGLNTAINGGSAPSPRTFITSDYNPTKEGNSYK
jgi:hypothetical protein